MKSADSTVPNQTSRFAPLSIFTACLIALLTLATGLGCNNGGGRDGATPDLCIGDDTTGDSDMDGTCDDLDGCDADQAKQDPGDCGCGNPDIDGNGNTTSDCLETESNCFDNVDNDNDGDLDCADADCAGVDTDGDTVDDCAGDACPEDASKTAPGQCGCGNAETDTDGDGVADCNDPCPMDNPDDSDGDGSCDSGDACVGNDLTGDSDGDGICDDMDACTGDDATGDTDGDGVCDDIDACVGDDATGDSDGDGICDDMDACTGDDATGDSDGDGVCDDIDACTGDDASGDTDLDGVCDDTDNCPNDANPGQTDSDGDGQGDVCDQENCSDDFQGADSNGNMIACWRDPATNNPCGGASIEVLITWDASTGMAIVQLDASANPGSGAAVFSGAMCDPLCSDMDPTTFTCQIDDDAMNTETLEATVSGSTLTGTLTLTCADGSMPTLSFTATERAESQCAP